MSIQNAQILEGATLTATGGTAKQYAPSGVKVENGIQIIDTTVVDPTIRPFYNVSSRPAAYNRNSGWTPDKRNVNAVRPFVDAAGVQQFPSIEIRCNYIVGMTAAQRTELEKMAAQVFIDADFATLLTTGSLG